MVHTKIIGNFAVIIHIERGEVGELANFERTDAVVAAEGIRGVDCGGGNGFGGRHAHLRASERQNRRHGKRGAGAGIEIRGEADDGASADQLARGPVLREAEMEAAAGEHRAGDVGMREGANVAGEYFFEMVRACRVHLDGKFRRAGARKLFGVKAQAQAAGSGRSQNFPRLSDGERASVAKHVAELRKIFRRYARQPFAADQLDISVGRLARAMAVLVRDHVRAKKGANNVEWLLAFQFAQDEKNLALAFPREAVAGFGFERRGSVRGELREMCERAAF